MKKTILQMALFSLLTVLAAGVATADRIGVLLQDSDGSSGGYATTLKLSSGDWSVTGGVATVTVFGEPITVADTNDTTAYVGLWESATGSQSPKTDGVLTYNAGTGTLMATAFVGALTGDVTGTASLASGLIGTPNIDVAAIGATSINTGDGNFTGDENTTDVPDSSRHYNADAGNWDVIEGGHSIGLQMGAH